MRQIEAGAPVDVFASAALKDMEDLDHQGWFFPIPKLILPAMPWS